MGKRRDPKKKAKKVKRPVQAAIASARTLAQGNKAADEKPAVGASGVPECIRKLESDDAENREAALQDCTHLVLVPGHRELLVSHGVTALAARCLCADDAAPVRASAASALRNILLTGDDSEADALYPNPEFDLVAGITMSLAAAIDEAANLETAASPSPAAEEAAAASAATEGEEGEAGEQPTPADHHGAQLTGAYKDVEEMLLLATVLSEANESVAEALSAHRHNEFMARLMASIRCDGHVEVQQCAAECLKVLSEDNENVATFMNDLDAAGKAFLNGMATTPPASPALLRVCVSLCGALLNVAPTVESVAMVLPALVGAISTSSMQTIHRMVPLLSHDCQLDSSVRSMGVAQGLDRLRCMQGALQGLTDALQIVCDQQDDDLDDEDAFAANPAAAVVMESPLLQTLVERTAEVMVAPSDPLVRKVILEPSESSEIVVLQRVLASVEVGVLSLTSSFMLLLPLNAFGSLAQMWQLIGRAIQDRHDRLDAAVRHSRRLRGMDPAGDDEEADAQHEAVAVASGTGLLCLPLQLESLVEMSATLQRKDEAGESNVEPAHLDTFTRLAWNPNSTPVTKSQVLAVVGQIGCRIRSPQIMHSCGNFCNRLMVKAIELAQQNGGELAPEVADVTAESLDAIMDLFGDEDFDDNTYVPLGIDGNIRTLLPMVKRYTQSIRGATKRGSPAWLRKRHLEEITNNTQRFLQYKREHCPAIAQQAAGQKHKFK